MLLLGQIENPYKYIKNSELYVISSKDESFSLTLVEAMFLKKLVISVKSNGPIEILKNNKYGVLVENNADEMAEKINYYLENKDERKKYEELGYERAKDFSKENGKKVIEEFIDRL